MVIRPRQSPPGLGWALRLTATSGAAGTCRARPARWCAGAPHPGRRPGAGCACPQPRREIGCGRGCHGDGRTHGSQYERLDVSAQVHGSLAHQAVIGEARPQISHRRHYLGDVEMIHVGRKLLVERPDAQPGRHVGHGPPIAIQRNLQIGSKLEELVGRRLVERGEPSDEATSDSRLARVGTGQTARFQAVLRDKAPDNRGHEVVQQQVDSENSPKSRGACRCSWR